MIAITKFNINGFQSCGFPKQLEYIEQLSLKNSYALDVDTTDSGEWVVYGTAAPGIFGNRYDNKELEKISTLPQNLNRYIEDRETQKLINSLELDTEKFWYLLLFIFDYSYGMCMDGMPIKETPIEQMGTLIEAIHENIEKITEDKSAIFKLPIEITIKVGRKNTTIDDPDAITHIMIGSWKQYTEVKDYPNMNTSKANNLLNLLDSESKAESDSRLCYYFAQMLFDFFNLQPQIVEKRRTGATHSDKEKELVSRLVYLSKIFTNKAFIYSNDALKSILKQGKDYQFNTQNRYYVC